MKVLFFRTLRCFSRVHGSDWHASVAAACHNALSCLVTNRMEGAYNDALTLYGAGTGNRENYANDLEMTQQLRSWHRQDAPRS